MKCHITFLSQIVLKNTILHCSLRDFCWKFFVKYIFTEIIFFISWFGVPSNLTQSVPGIRAGFIMTLTKIKRLLKVIHLKVKLFYFTGCFFSLAPSCTTCGVLCLWTCLRPSNVCSLLCSSGKVIVIACIWLLFATMEIRICSSVHSRSIL